MMGWLRFGIAALLMAGGLFFMVVAVVGVFRLRYSMNRLHATALAETMGFLLCVASLIVAFGFSLGSLKLLTAVVFMWITCPLSSHLIARLQLLLETAPQEHMEHMHLDNDGEEDAPC